VGGIVAAVCVPAQATFWMASDNVGVISLPLIHFITLSDDQMCA
jgi:hypothetical protein